jgi:hypothetical protein
MIKQIRILPLLILILLLVSIPNAYSIIIERTDGKTVITDEQVKEAAIANGAIPESPEDFDMEKELESKNTIIIWINMDRNDKIRLIDTLKEKFRENGVIIGYPSEYYVNEINGVIYNDMQREEMINPTKKGVGAIFKSIALMDGDYNNGGSRIEALREYSGEELFEYYKEHYPEKYEYLLKLDSEE